MLKSKKWIAWCLIILLSANLIPQSFNTVHASEMNSTFVAEDFNEEVEENKEIESSKVVEESTEEQQIHDDLKLEDATEIDYQTESDEVPPAPEDENGTGNIVDGIENQIFIAYDIPQVRATSTGLSLAQLRQKFPAGKYWNHAGNPGSSNSKNNQNGYTSTPCPKHKTVGTDVQTCNGFQPGSQQLSWQCMGYAEKLGYDATGYNPRENKNGWNTYTNVSALNNLKAGDIVRYKNDVHSIYVTDVNGDTVTYTDCNSDGHCIIRWGVTISKTTLRSSFTYVRSAPSAQSPETVSCSCSTSYAGNYVCTTSSLNLNMRSGHGTSYGIVTAIPSGAVVYVSKSDGTWAHVSYNGYTGYASMQYLTKQGTTQARKSGIRTWISNSEMGDVVDSVRTGEWVYLCYKMYDANTGDMFDTYNTIGYRAKMEIFGPSGKLENSAEYSQDNSWISIKRTTPGTYTGKVTVTFDSQYSSKVIERTFNIVYEPRIETTVSSVDLNVLGTSSQTVSIGYSGATASESIYVNTSKTGDCFTTSWGNWSNHVIPLTITGTKSGTGSVTVYLRDSNTDEILATKVITVSVEAPEYTITYSANGGNGAPSSQTKDYGVSLSLSRTIPTRFGYKFLGWSTSSTATSASYSPGANFTANANTTLYAVWESASTISSEVTNSGYSTGISYSNQEKYYSFTPSFSGKVRFESTGNSDTQVYLYNSSGTQLDYDDDDGADNNFLLTYAVSANTKYYVKVRYYSSGTGTLDFDVKRVYDITYNANGGNGAPSTQEKVHGTALILSTTRPTRSGYSFLGWSTSSTATSASYQPGDNYIGNANVTLYAVWGNNSYTITYNANGGSGAPSIQTKSHGTNITLSTTIPTRLGYNFLGWSSSSSATSVNYLPGDGFTTNANTTLYAVWANAPSISSDMTNSGYNTTISYANQENCFSFTPSFSGKVRFESFGDSDTQIYLSDSTGTYLASDDDGGNNRNFLLTHDVADNTKYYIIVKYYGSGTGTISFDVKRVYDINYNANGGSGAPASQEKVHGTALTLSTAVPTRSGYSFLGWSTSSTATSASYQSGASYTGNGNVTLYAVWGTNSYTIAYNANGGTGAPSTQTKEVGKALELSSTVPTRFGWNFKGWGTSMSSKAEYQPGDSYQTDESVTLYAVWEQMQTSIKAEYHNDTTINYLGNGVYYKVVPETTALYRFRSTGKWDTNLCLYDEKGTRLAENDDGGEELNFELTYQLEKGKTYYVYASLYGNNTVGTFKTDMYRGYVISYDTNGGKETFANEYFYTYYKDYKLTEWLNVKSPTRNGYTFVEWNTAKDGSGATFDLENRGEEWCTYLLQKGNITLYAIWEEENINENPFSDVVDTVWYASAVRYVYDNGIMSGSNGLFNPTGNITRAQVVATLYKLEGSPKVTDYSAVTDMPDVEAGQWYTDAVCWAYSVGVANGNSVTKKFNLNDPVTRQQLATFFYNYAKYKGLDTTTRGDISGMAGADQVASYALDTVKWAVGTGLITGSETTVNGVTVKDLKPTGTATRAQMAAILQRFVENNDL